jgi:antitoxin ParD1/3/4
MENQFVFRDPAPTWYLCTARGIEGLLIYIHNMDIFNPNQSRRLSMTMHVNLSEEMEKYIRNKVASGFYGNATEVIRDAIRRMQTEESRMAAWQTAIAKGNVQLDQGEGIPYTPELMEQMTQSAIATMHNGQPIDPDVLP